MNEEQVMNEHKRAVLLHLERVIVELVRPHFMDEACVSLFIRVPGNQAANILITGEPDSRTQRSRAVFEFSELMKTSDNRGLVGEQPDA